LIIPVFAPPSENPTATYVADVAAWMGIGPDDRLDLSQPAALRDMVKAMMRQEDGSVPYTDGTILAAVDDALGISQDTVQGA
jgi:hypothetical protein